MQASEPTYELHTLGWKAFQHLCASITSEIWGQTVQGFYDSNDGGRDGAYYGTWAPKTGELFSGSFTVQCKFTSQPGGTLALSDMSDEIAKATRLAKRRLADNYILLTNARLTGVSVERMTEAFQKIPGIKRFAAYGADRITQFIRESPRLRMLVPRVYGLGDLSQILDGRAYDQAKEILSSLGDDLEKFVITDAYRSSARALVDHGFVLLLGEPACGKSAIAAALSLGAVDEWGCSTLKVRDAEEFVKHSNPHEPRQFFWVDDAFGGTQLDIGAAIGWNSAFPHVRAAIRRGAKIVFTSRDYIYRNARTVLKQSALPVLNESQVIIRVEQLSKDEREQILYNHIRLGSQPNKFKKEIKPYLPDVAAHKRFSPEIARRLGHPAFTKKLDISKYDLDDFVERPVPLLREVVQTLSEGMRAAIALIFMRSGMLESPISVAKEEEQALALLGASLSGVREGLNSLDGSLLIQVQQSGSSWWRFKHPTIRDAFGSVVAEDRALMDIYLAGTPVRQLLIEIACGDVEWEGAKVQIPPDRFDVVISRMEAFGKADRDARDPIHHFLSGRCDAAFLKHFMGRFPNFLKDLHVRSYFYAISDMDVIERLDALGLLPEPERQRHVAVVEDHAVSIPDSGFIDGRVGFLRPAEVTHILGVVRTKLIPDLEATIDSWRDNWSSEEDPSAYYDHLQMALKDYKRAFADDKEANDLIDKALTAIDTTISETEYGGERDWGDHYGGRSGSLGSASDRSTFDDVDQ